jgi:hypothetical protein
MQIQLKQTEIIQALKLYISSQGINLGGKTVDVAFTAGRKEAGLSADVQIEDAHIQAVPIPVFATHAATPIAAEVMTELDAEEETALPVKGASLFG